MSNTYLSFVVGEEQFAVNVTKVLEVLQKQTITKVPNAPDFIKGIINFRGEVVPVFEMRVKFNLAERDETKGYVIIILDLQSGEETIRIGAIADKVRDVITLNDSDIKPVPAMNKDFNTEFLQGIVKLNDKFILLLNVDKVFTSNQLQQLHDSSEVLKNA
ncbi:MAG TPA: chemotaxis protein CheW [Bacteroidales bacterium]|nr:chemotaxis protein CheW [Bacteroidales bacterium]